MCPTTTTSTTILVFDSSVWSNENSIATMQWGCHRPLLIRRARRAFSVRVAGSNCHGQHVQPVCSRKVRMMLANIALATPKQILNFKQSTRPNLMTIYFSWLFFHFFFGGVAICAIFFWFLLGSFGTHFQVTLLRPQELEMLKSRVEDLQRQLQRRDEVCWGTAAESGIKDGGLLGISRNRWLKGEHIWTYDNMNIW